MVMPAFRDDRIWTALLWLGLGLSGALAACTKTEAPRFPHIVHLTGIECGKPGQAECLSCASCHSPKQAERAHRLPDSRLCDECHKETAHRSEQILSLDPPRPYGEIHFDHDQHLAMPKLHGQCTPCHAGVVESGAERLPPMSQCFSCHEHQSQWDRAECSPCHETQDLKRTLPRTFLRHDASFVRHHAQEATLSESLCQSCHSQSDCQACHDMTQTLSIESRAPEKVMANFVHQGDFMVRHGMEAQADPARCASCHTPKTCDSCHVLRGVSGNALASVNPHPPGWVGNETRSPDFHGRAARRDLLSCAACHDQGPATNCIRCHQVGAFGGNPHPRGWQSSQSTFEGMCRYCHEAR